MNCDAVSKNYLDVCQLSLVDDDCFLDVNAANSHLLLCSYRSRVRSMFVQIHSHTFTFGYGLEFGKVRGAGLLFYSHMYGMFHEIIDKWFSEKWKFWALIQFYWDKTALQANFPRWPLSYVWYTQVCFISILYKQRFWD